MPAGTVADAPPDGKRATPATDYTINAVARAVDLLAAFERPPHQFGVSELARSLGLTKNLVFRVLRTLETAGFVLRVDGPAPSSQYAIGMRLFDLSRYAVDRRHVLLTTARPFLAELRRQTLETAYLVAQDGEFEAVCLERVESEFSVRNRVDVGMRLPLFAGGGTKALLAFLAAHVQDHVIAELVRPLTPATPTVADDVRRDLARIRQDGYWIALEEYASGLDAVGAPIFDATGAAVGGLGISGPVPRLRHRLVSPELRGRLVEPVVAAATAISHQLGFVGPYPPAPAPGSLPPVINQPNTAVLV